LFSNNSETLVLGEFGAFAYSSLRFLGPPRGIVPIAPANSRLGLKALEPSPLSSAEKNTAIISYNYTFNHQGLTIDTNCTYDTQSPIRFSTVPNNTLSLVVNSSCNEIGLAEVPLAPDHSTLNTNHTLTFWACKSIPTREKDTAYYIYLRGRGDYETEIGNISCTVSPVPAVFPVTYQSSTRIFSTQEQVTTSTPAKTFSDVIEFAISSLGSVVQQAQTRSANMVAAIVRDFTLKASVFSPMVYEPNEHYLPWYAAMIQGILVDQVCTANNSSPLLLMVIPQVTLIRFLYTILNGTVPPASCIRTMNGMMNAEVTGWVAKPVHIGFLMPMTILNLSSLIIVLISIAKAKGGCHELDLTDPRTLVFAESSLDESEPSGWADSVLYRSREVRECHMLFRW